MNSTNDILSIKGVGEKTARLFRKIGIDTVEDLIHDYPRDYVVYPEPKKLKAAQDGEMIAVFLQLQETFSFKKFRNLTIGTGKAVRPLPLLRFAVSATGGAHLCSIQYYLRFWPSSCRTSLAVSALRIMRYCLYSFLI